MVQEKVKPQLGKGISITLFVLAGLMLFSGVILLIIILSTANSVQSYDLYFQMMGIGELAQMVLHPLKVVMINLGIFSFIIFLVFSVLLAAAGWLVNRQSRLVARIAALEEKVEHSEHQDR